MVYLWVSVVVLLFTVGLRLTRAFGVWFCVFGCFEFGLCICLFRLFCVTLWFSGPLIVFFGLHVADVVCVC